MHSLQACRIEVDGVGLAAGQRQLDRLCELRKREMPDLRNSSETGGLGHRIDDEAIGMRQVDLAVTAPRTVRVRAMEVAVNEIVEGSSSSAPVSRVRSADRRPWRSPYASWLGPPPVAQAWVRRVMACSVEPLFAVVKASLATSFMRSLTWACLRAGKENERFRAASARPSKATR